MTVKFRAAQQLFQQNELSRALDVLNECISEDTTDLVALQLRARIHYKMQNWGGAMNDYTSVLEIDPNDPEAKSGLEMVRSILGYFTPEMFNP